MTTEYEFHPWEIWNADGKTWPDYPSETLVQLQFRNDTRAVLKHTIGEPN